MVPEALALRPSHSLAIVHVGSAHFSVTTTAGTIVCVVSVSGTTDVSHTPNTAP